MGGHEVFISYAHLDNRALTPEEHGWISRFHRALETLLAMRLGRDARIWRDAKLRGNDEFDEEILGQLRQSMLFVSVLTPRYLQSDWCPREAREFCEAAAHSGGISVRNRSRIFKLIKTPVELGSVLPEPFHTTLGYEFFVRDETGAPLDLDPAFGVELGQAFNRKVAQLAWHIAELLRALAQEQAVASKGNVYLAETSHDRADDRERLAADLRLSGYHVLPDVPLPRDEAGYVRAVRALLASAELSIHLIGSKPDAIPEGPTGKCGIQVQNGLASEQSRAGQLRRVISLVEGARGDSVGHAAFLRELERNEAAQLGAELLTGDLESLKHAVYAILDRHAVAR
jgi:hypothetical protein